MAANRPNSIPNLDLDKIENLPEFDLNHTNIQDVYKLLFQISDTKATGTDGIHVKIAHHITIPMLTFIINLSIDTCSIPDDW